MAVTVSRRRLGRLAERATDAIWGKWRAAAGVRRKSGGGGKVPRVSFLPFIYDVIC
jgi:hypothetical protein